MKKFVFVMLAFSLVSFCFSQNVPGDEKKIFDPAAAENVLDDSVSQELSDADKAFSEIKTLLDDGFEKNKIRISELAKNLDYKQKLNLYEQYEKSATEPFFLNVLGGWGMGSFIQGNKKSGLVQLSFDAAALLCVISGSVISNRESASGSALIVCGGGLYLGGLFTACISPWVFASDYNDQLRDSLNFYHSKISVVPLVNPIDNSYGFVAKISL